MVIISADSAPQAYVEMMWALKINGRREHSRNGPVLTIPTPTLLQIRSPQRRVILDATRDCNHIFHVMEFIWMMAGRDDVTWLTQFNKGYAKYAESNGRAHGAYGFRWRNHFGKDQILGAVEALRKNHADRRVVLGMWDPTTDLCIDRKDLPCNTHIYLRIVDGNLDMSVCNRSNDGIWGMLGANVVHMTLLQELLARAIGVGIGTYRVFTNNLHVYEDLPNVKTMLGTTIASDPYRCIDPYPILAEGETIEDFLYDCVSFLSEDAYFYRTRWIMNVAIPMRNAYLLKANRFDSISRIAAEDWRLACGEWAARRSPVAFNETV